MSQALAVLAALSNASWFYGMESSRKCLDFRLDFELPDTPTEATAGIASAGYGELWVNGRKADETAVLEPAWSQWNKRLLVPTYNISHLLRPGNNTIGLALGAGWYGMVTGIPGIKAAVVAQASAFQKTVVTDGSWQVGPCPVTYNEIWRGEKYDARLQSSDWALPGGGRGWKAAVPEAKPPKQTEGAVLTLQQIPPIRKLELVPVVELVTTLPDGAVILDFGKNLAGWVRLSMRNCSSGTVVTLRHAEVLIGDRTALYVDNLRSANATDVYTCAGGPVAHEPRFTYHGFRFVEMRVEGSADWSWTEQSARIVHSAVSERGHISMENPVLTRIQDAIRRTQTDNLHSVPTDCPQRDERQGWMADAAVSAEQAMHNFDMKSFYTNWLQVVVDAQETNNDFGDCRMPEKMNTTRMCKGAVTDTSPHVPGTFGQRPADPSWGVALPLIADLLSQHYGSAVADKFTPAVHEWADFLLSVREESGIVKYHYYGDWLQPGKVASDPLISHMAAGFSALLALDYASKLGSPPDRARYADEFKTMRSKYLSIYWNSTVNSFGDGTQAAQVFALKLGGLSTEQDAAAWGRLQELLSKQGIDTGIIATKWLFPLLSLRGRTDLGLQLASSSAYPSWGYMLAKGATTVWEHWDAFGHGESPHMSSHNHPAFTSVGAWFYTDLVGIRVDQSSLELGPTLDVHNDLLPNASGELTLDEGVAKVSWSTRPVVQVAGECPRTAGCSVRVPLDGMSFQDAATILGPQAGGHGVSPCGSAAACVQVTKGAFSLKLRSASVVTLV